MPRHEVVHVLDPDAPLRYPVASLADLAPIPNVAIGIRQIKWFAKLSEQDELLLNIDGVVLPPCRPPAVQLHHGRIRHGDEKRRPLRSRYEPLGALRPLVLIVRRAPEPKWSAERLHVSTQRDRADTVTNVDGRADEEFNIEHDAFRTGGRLSSA